MASVNIEVGLNDKRQVVLKFTESLSWVGLKPKQARIVAIDMLRYAEQAEAR